MKKELTPSKMYCQIFKRSTSHYGNKVLKRCKSIAVKEFKGKKMCVNCFAKLSEKGDKGNG